MTFFKDYTQKVWGIDCTSLPASWGHQRVKELNIIKTLIAPIKAAIFRDKTLNQKHTTTSLIQQFLYPAKGPGQLWETVANKIIEQGGQIRLNTTVSELVFDRFNKLTQCHATDVNNGTSEVLIADVFISSMPIKELVEKSATLNLPPNIKAISNGLNYRDFLIVGILVKTSDSLENIKKNKIQDNWIYLQDKNLKAGRVQFFHNWSPFMVCSSENEWIGVEYFVNESDALWKLNDKEISQLAIDEMEKTGLLNSGQVLDSTVIRVKKAYPSYDGTYERFIQLRSHLDRIPNLYLIGRNGMHKYNTTDHSMLTAIEAVRNISENKISKENIWNVNTDPSYHEVK